MLSPYYASRTGWDFSRNKLSRRVAALRSEGKILLDLTQSNPTACGIPHPSGFLNSLANSANLCYEPHSLGLLSAREAIAREYQRQGVWIDPENIVLTASTSEAYSFIMRLLAESGDHVLFPRPSYPLLDHLAALNDVYVDRYFLSYEGQWGMNLDSLRQAITPRTRAVVLVNPNNPTGSFVKRAEWQTLQKLCADHNLAVISDEVFADYAWGPDKHRVAAVAGNPDVLTFALGGVSKMLGLPQMKLAWTAVSGPVGPRRQAMQRLEMIADTYLSVNTPAQHALPGWLAQREETQRPIRERIAVNLRYLNSIAWEKAGCEVLPAEGGWYAILRVPATKSEEQWALEILERKHVLVHPGYFFDFKNEAYLVLSLLPPPDAFAQALDGMRESLL